MNPVPPVTRHCAPANIAALYRPDVNFEVFFTADDFGSSSETNHAIVRAHREGALQGASLMMGQAATEEAIALARENPRLQIGWHLHLCDSHPVTCAQWPWGDAPSRAGWAIGLSPKARALMRREVAAQWDSFRASGLTCAFVNSHHHLHSHPMVYGVLMEVLPRDYTGWLRLGTPQFFTRTVRACATQLAAAMLTERRRRRCPFRASDTIWGLDRLFNMQPREIAAVIPRLPAGLHEFYFHPRSVADDADLTCLMELKAHGF